MTLGEPAVNLVVENFCISEQIADPITSPFDLKKHAEMLKSLGKHKTGTGCLYINKLADVDAKILEKMIISALK